MLQLVLCSFSRYTSRMDNPRDTDDDLAHDLGFALWQAMRKRIPIDECRTKAKAALAHLKLSGWQWHRRPPVKPHG